MRPIHMAGRRNAPTPFDPSATAAKGTIATIGGFWVAAAPAAITAHTGASSSSRTAIVSNEKVNGSVCALSAHQMTGPAKTSHVSHPPSRGSATQNASTSRPTFNAANP